MDNQSKSFLRVTKSPNDGVENSATDATGKEKPLSHAELMAQIATKGTVYERELCVVENLKKMGF